MVDEARLFCGGDLASGSAGGRHRAPSKPLALLKKSIRTRPMSSVRSVQPSQKGAGRVVTRVTDEPRFPASRRSFLPCPVRRRRPCPGRDPRPKLSGSQPARACMPAPASRRSQPLRSHRAPIPFESIYRHGFARVAVATPRVEVASPALNAAADDRTGAAAQRETRRARAVPGAGPLGVFERGPVPAGCAARRCRWRRSPGRRGQPRAALVLVVGLPLRVDDRLFNCGVVHAPRPVARRRAEDLPAELSRVLREAAVRVRRCRRLGRRVRLLGADGAVRHRTCSSRRRTCRASCCTSRSARTSGCRCRRARSRRWPARRCIANLSASNITVGKAEYRRLLCASQSAKCVAAYLYSAAGPGESTTDLAWDGHALIYENGERLAESQRFPLEGGLITADLDLDHLRQERMR